MRVQPSVAVFLFFLPVLSACRQAGEQAAADVAAINRLSGEVDVAFNAGDAAGLVALVTDDVVWMPPNEPPISGEEAIKSRYQALFERFSVEHSLTSEEIQVTDEWAVRRGAYTVTMTPKAGGNAIHDRGKFIDIWQQQPNGAWKIARVIWNSDNPLSGME